MSTIVMTGGTSGFGAIASETLTRSGHARLILGARRRASVGETMPLELSELDSVRAFKLCTVLTARWLSAHPDV